MFSESVEKTVVVGEPTPATKAAATPNLGLTYWHKRNLNDKEYTSGDARLTDYANANLLGALRQDGSYQLLLDLDWGAEFKDNQLWAKTETGESKETKIYGGILIPSANNWHYYGPNVMDYVAYRNEMHRLFGLGILQSGFYNQLDRYGFCFLRPWWIKKTDKVEQLAW